ncbi:MAG: ABC transporter substrate-binding protein [Ignavibacteriae bacterium]|nr:ABC transporter substrate-binding protein [Ignavibacteriota bacterium]
MAIILSDCQPKDDKKPSGVEKIIATHALGLCNMPLFILAEKQFAKADNVQVDLTYIPNWGDHAAALKGGGVDISVTPFTNVITAFANGMPVRIIAGSGINGLYLLGQKGVKIIKQLKGKRIGTFRSDTLELIAYDAIRDSGMTRNDYEMVYFTDGFALMNAFANKSIDAMTQVEPYATQAVQKYGAEIITTGQNSWGNNYPDCVLVTSENVLKTRRSALKAVIVGMLKAEAFIEKDYDSAVNLCVGKYYKADKNDILLAGQSQPPGVDIRDKKQFKEHPELLAAVKIRASSK